VSKSQTVEVRLSGQKIVLKTAESVDPSQVKAVMELVTQRIGAVEARNSNLAPHHTALLALVDLAEEYLAAKRRTENFKQEISSKSSQLLSLIEPEGK